MAWCFSFLLRSSVIILVKTKTRRGGFAIDQNIQNISRHEHHILLHNGAISDIYNVSCRVDEHIIGSHVTRRVECDPMMGNHPRVLILVYVCIFFYV